MSVSRRGLDANELKLLASSRRAVLATIAADGRPRLVPIAYAFTVDAATELVLYSALDEKPKSVADPRNLARVKDVVARPRVSVLVDSWSEEWSDLEWVRLDGTARLLDPKLPAHAPEHGRAVDLLRQRYPQYATHRLEDRPVLRIVVEHASYWSSRA